jgi:hypothetical protein
LRSAYEAYRLADGGVPDLESLRVAYCRLTAVVADFTVLPVIAELPCTDGGL